MKRTPARAPPLHAERQDAAGAVRQVASRERLVAVAAAAAGSCTHSTAGCAREVLRDRERRFAVPRHAQVQRLDALQQQERRERRRASGPSVRIVSMRAFIVKPKSPNVS